MKLVLRMNISKKLGKFEVIALYCTSLLFVFGLFFPDNYFLYYTTHSNKVVITMNCMYPAANVANIPPV